MTQFGQSKATHFLTINDLLSEVFMHLCSQIVNTLEVEHKTHCELHRYALAVMQDGKTSYEESKSVSVQVLRVCEFLSLIENDSHSFHHYFSFILA